jgi:ABC-type transport system involved in cytochrome c biogenesis permease subunit
MARAMGVLENVSIFCFAASYGVALALEIVHLISPRPVLRYLGLGFGIAGLLAQLAYLLVRRLPLASPSGSLLFLALILVIFYVYGTIHHRRLAWALFVLPLILGLIGLAVALRESSVMQEGDVDWPYFWSYAHGILVLLAAVGVCVGFIASVMYLVQLHRLRAKVAPGQGMKLLSLERLEVMNRRAILWAFPLLTAGLLIGIAVQIHNGDFGKEWDTPKILSSVGLWVLFAIVLFLRYWVHARGRQLALLTMVAFAVVIIVLASPPHQLPGGSR